MSFDKLSTKKFAGTIENSLATYQLKCVFCFTLWQQNDANAYFVSHYDNKIRKCVFCFTLWKQNDICLMVSHAKLCNNVANYGTKGFLIDN